MRSPTFACDAPVAPSTAVLPSDASKGTPEAVVQLREGPRPAFVVACAQCGGEAGDGTRLGAGAVRFGDGSIDLRAERLGKQEAGLRGVEVVRREGHVRKGPIPDRTLDRVETLSYADCNERDHAALVAAVRAGRLEARGDA